MSKRRIYATLSDNSCVCLNENVINNSEVLKNLFEDINDERTDIQLPIIKQSAMSKIIEFCNYYGKHPLLENKFVESKFQIIDNINITDKWEREFCESMTTENIIDVIRATDYLQMLLLKNILCVYVGQKIVDNNTSENIISILGKYV